DGAAGLGQPKRHRPADAAAGAGDNRDAPIQIGHEAAPSTIGSFFSLATLRRSGYRCTLLRSVANQTQTLQTINVPHDDAPAIATGPGPRAVRRKGDRIRSAEIPVERRAR